MTRPSEHASITPAHIQDMLRRTDELADLIAAKCDPRVDALLNARVIAAAAPLSQHEQTHLANLYHIMERIANDYGYDSGKRATHLVPLTEPTNKWMRSGLPRHLEHLEAEAETFAKQLNAFHIEEY
jgi:hypothetical protein